MKKPIFFRCSAAAVFFSSFMLLIFPSPAFPGKSPAASGGSRIIFHSSGFAFTRGAWAEYSVKNLIEESSHVLSVSIHEKGKFRGNPGRWIEVKIRPEDEPGAVVRFLAEETPSGPGAVMRLIVQPEGSEPFYLPRLFLRAGGGQAPDFNAFEMPAGTEPERTKWQGREIDVLQAEWEEPDGTRSSAVISPEAPPLGIVFFADSRAEMTLKEWGSGAETGISGEPISFFSWIMRRAAKAEPGAGAVPPAENL